MWNISSSQLVGIAFSAMGIYILVQKNKTVSSFIDFIFDPACDLCLAGLIILVIAFFGCGGALREFILFLRIVSILQSFYMYYYGFCLLLWLIVRFMARDDGTKERAKRWKHDQNWSRYFWRKKRLEIKLKFCVPNQIVN